MSDIICRSITISGKVQGVFFRHHTKTEADKLQITGFVRNESDGTVFILAEGQSRQIKIFIEWCHRGSPNAVVESVKVNEVSREGFSDFLILR